MKMVWLQQRGLIASQKTCRKCDSNMRFGGKSGVTDGFVWRCKRKGCKTTVQLGGPGRIVQIDESLFAHKLKYRRGRAPQSEIWVFGMADKFNEILNEIALQYRVNR